MAVSLSSGFCTSFAVAIGQSGNCATGANNDASPAPKSRREGATQRSAKKTAFESFFQSHDADGDLMQCQWSGCQAILQIVDIRRRKRRSGSTGGPIPDPLASTNYVYYLTLSDSVDCLVAILHNQRPIETDQAEVGSCLCLHGFQVVQTRDPNRRSLLYVTSASVVLSSGVSLIGRPNDATGLKLSSRCLKPPGPEFGGCGMDGSLLGATPTTTYGAVTERFSELPVADSGISVVGKVVYVSKVRRAVDGPAASNDGGRGPRAQQFFEVVLCDVERRMVTCVVRGTRVRAVCDALVPDRLYYFRGGTRRVSGYTTVSSTTAPQAGAPIVFDSHSTVEPCREGSAHDSSQYPTMTILDVALHQRIELNAIATQSASVRVGDTVSVLGRVITAPPATTCQTQRGVVRRRRVQLTDYVVRANTGRSEGPPVDLTLWDVLADTQITFPSVLFVHNAVVREYGGQWVLSSKHSTELINVTHLTRQAEASALFSVDLAATGLSEHSTTIQQPVVLPNEAPTLRASITYMATPLTYVGCPQCRMKLVAPYCQKCQQQISGVPYYKISCVVGDGLTCMWATGFNRLGEALFGVSAEEAQQHWNANPEKVKQFIQTILFVPLILTIETPQHGGDVLIHDVKVLTFDAAAQEQIRAIESYDPST